MCLALKDHNAVMPVRLESAAPRSRIKYSTTEPLRSLASLVMPNCDSKGIFFYPTLTLMIDSYSIFQLLRAKHWQSCIKFVASYKSVQCECNLVPFWTLAPLSV